MKKNRLLTVMVVCVLISAGCASSKGPRSRPEMGYIPEPVSTLPQKHYPGSLWEEEHSRALLFADRKASKVNDIVTVIITESAAATGSTSTKTDRNSSSAAEVSSLFGLPGSLGMSNFLGSGAPFQPKVGGSAQNSFDGSGDTARKNTLSATITARVVSVFPNGTMGIVGTREVTINNEAQYIVLKGTIRREDILPNNTIRSDSIADATIEYYGEGVLADKNSPGWLARAVDWAWPF